MKRNKRLEERRKKIPKHIDDEAKKSFDDIDLQYSKTTNKSYEGDNVNLLKLDEEAFFPRFDIIHR